MSTYLLFAYESYYPNGGMGDFVAKAEFATDEQAVEWAKTQDAHACRHIDLVALTDDGYRRVAHAFDAYNENYEWKVGA